MDREYGQTLSASMEDYLRAIYELERHTGPVSTSALADRLGVASASVTGMLKRLHRDGLVDHERYAGVSLTGKGRVVALEVIRHHRLIETYLAEAMGLSWDEVHEEAHRLEHHISETLEDRMDEILGYPDRDPHGAPIPPKEGAFNEPTYRTLASAESGEALEIREVDDDDPERLRYLAALGLVPDTIVTILEVAPFDGPITLRIRDGEIDADGGVNNRSEVAQTVGRQIAESVFVAEVQ